MANSQTNQSQAPASSAFGQHENAYVPHHISDHTKALQVSVMTEQGWVNINDTLDQMNDRKDLYVVHDQVEKAQEDIGNAQSAAQNAVSKAESAVQTAAVTSDTVAGMSNAISDATSGATVAVSQARDALANADKAKSELQAAITSNSNAIALKADKTDVDVVSDEVKQHSASINVLNNEIKNSVTASTIDGLLDKKGYATQTYTQDLVKQTSNTWGVNLSKLEGKVDDNQKLNLKQMTNLQASIDGIQGTVVDNEKKTESRFTQLADGFQSKVFDVISDSTKKGADFNSRYQTISDPTDLDTMITVGSYYLTGALTHSPYTPEPASSASDSSASATSESASTADSGSSSANSSASAPAEAPATDPGNVILEVFVDGKGDDPTAPDANIEQRIYREGDDTAYSRQGKTFTLADDKKTVASWTWHEWSKDADSSITQLKDDINWKVSNGDLISQINMEAGRTLIDSNKIYLNAESVVFSKGSKAFIPDAAITNLSADKIDAGTLKGINIINGDITNGGKFVSVGTPTTKIEGDKKTSLWPVMAIQDGGIVFSSTTTLENPGEVSSSRFGLIQTQGVLADHNGQSPSIYMDATGGFALRNEAFDQYTDATSEILIGHPTNYGDELKKSLYDYTVGKVHLLTWKPDAIASSEIEVNSKKGITLRAQDGSTWIHVGDEERDDRIQLNLNKDNIGSQFAIQKNDGFTAVWGADGDGHAIQQTAAGRIGFHSLSAGTIYFDKNDHGSWHENLGLFDVFGNFVVSGGQKNSIVKTSQGWTAIHAYETAEYYFGDIGENNTGANGKVTIGIDQLFGQTVNTDMQYQVFITPYSNAHVWVSQRLKNRFVVESDQPNAEFGWEMKARRKGFEHTRLTNFSDLIK